MDKATAIRAVAFLTEVLRKQGLHVEQVVLFGSLVHGGADAESDLDVAIVSPDFEGKDIFERAALTRTAEVRTIKQFLVPIDLVAFTPGEFKQGTSLVARFVQDGETVAV